MRKNMKLVKSFIVLSLVSLVSACGQSNTATLPVCNISMPNGASMCMEISITSSNDINHTSAWKASDSVCSAFNIPSAGLTASLSSTSYSCQQAGVVGYCSYSKTDQKVGKAKLVFALSGMSLSSAQSSCQSIPGQFSTTYPKQEIN